MWRSIGKKKKDLMRQETMASRFSHLVTHPSTDSTQCRLTFMIMNARPKAVAPTITIHKAYAVNSGL